MLDKFDVLILFGLDYYIVVWIWCAWLRAKSGEWLYLPPFGYHYAAIALLVAFLWR